jgi:hypothetical protein
MCGKTQFIDSVVPTSALGGSGSASGPHLGGDDTAPVVCAYHEQCPKGFAVLIAASPTSQVGCTDCKLKGEFYSDELNAPSCTVPAFHHRFCQWSYSDELNAPSCTVPLSIIDSANGRVSPTLPTHRYRSTALPTQPSLPIYRIRACAVVHHGLPVWWYSTADCVVVLHS